MFRDGPLRRRPPEEIRYGTGKCALGHVLVAEGGQGIVSIVIRGSKAQLAGEVRERFPKAALLHDEKGCAGTVAKVLKYIAAPFRPFPLALDFRGTELQKRVWEEVRRIPFGATSSYSRIAEAIGAPKAIRAVASSCSRCMHAFAVPCHRVLHKGGEARDAGGGRRLSWVAYEAKLAAKRGRDR
jgi:AraC family transcriptional regulator of adaptative response/methylated-DNA-[protein]-cysteine methyltransferase